MKTVTRVVVSGCLFLACASALPADETPGCPDTMAVTVAARVEQRGQQRCGFGVSVFGKGVGVFGPKCPKAIYFYPAHPCCQNAQTNPGTRCTIDKLAPIQMQTCECNVLGVFGTGVKLPGCECKDAGGGGFLETGKTVDCVEG